MHPVRVIPARVVHRERWTPVDPSDRAIIQEDATTTDPLRSVRVVKARVHLRNGAPTCEETS